MIRIKTCFTQRVLQFDLNAASLKSQLNIYQVLNFISECRLVLTQQCDGEVPHNNTDMFQLLLDIYSATSTPSKQTLAWSTLWRHCYCAPDIIKCDSKKDFIMQHNGKQRSSFILNFVIKYGGSIFLVKIVIRHIEPGYTQALVAYLTKQYVTL